MRDSRNFLVLLVALVLITVAIVLVSLWGYRIYFGDPTREAAGISKENNLPITDTVYINQNSGKQGFQTSPRDSTELLLLKKLRELNKLQAEINALMQLSDTTNTLPLQEKVEGLRQHLEKLKNKNDSVSDQEISPDHRNRKGSREKANHRNSSNTHQGSTEVPAVTIDKLRMLVDESRDIGPNGYFLKRISVYFSVNTTSVPKGEIYVVITQPDGSVLENSRWESGVFEVPEGQKIYTGKLIFNSSSHQLSFRIKTSSIPSGAYSVGIYYDGKVLGMLRKTVNLLATR